MGIRIEEEADEKGSFSGGDREGDPMGDSGEDNCPILSEQRWSSR
jgi:hypothetical protein